MMVRAAIGLVLGVMLLACVGTAARADTLFSEDFATDTDNTSETLSTYTDWSVIGTTPVKVVNGVVEIEAQGSPYALQGFALPETFSGDLIIQLDLGTSTASGAYNVGLKIGDNNIVFHPGYGEGAFRVEGPGGFGGPGDNKDMGFTPAGGVLHHMTVTIDASTGFIEIEVVDGEDDSNVYSTSFTNTGYTDGAQIAFTTNGDKGKGFARFDNILVTSPVPEPGTLVLFGLGAVGLAYARTRRSAAAKP